MRLFVYGTLKRERSNHAWLRGQTFIGEAMTEPIYLLHDLGGYPGLVEDAAHGTCIHGEVWEVNEACLAQLDQLEDTAGEEYARVSVRLLPPFQQEPTQTYLYLRSVDDAPLVGASW